MGGAVDIDITDWDKFGSVIRSARIEAGLTQQELATRAGTARSWIARIEAGHRKAEFEPILRLLAALNLQMRLHPESGDETPGASTTFTGRGVSLDQAALARRRASQGSWAASQGAFRGRSDERPEVRP